MTHLKSFYPSARLGILIFSQFLWPPHHKWNSNSGWNSINSVWKTFGKSLWREIKKSEFWWNSIIFYVVTILNRKLEMVFCYSWVAGAYSSDVIYFSSDWNRWIVTKFLAKKRAGIWNSAEFQGISQPSPSDASCTGSVPHQHLLSKFGKFTHTCLWSHSKSTSSFFENDSACRT